MLGFVGVWVVGYVEWFLVVGGCVGYECVYGVVCVVVEGEVVEVGVMVVVCGVG